MVTRTRSNNDGSQTLTTIRQSWQTRDGGPWGKVNTNVGVNSTMVSERSMTDELTPGYRRLKASNAILPCNPMQKTEKRVTFKEGKTVTRNTTWPPYVSFYSMEGTGIVLNTAWAAKVPTVLPTISSSIPSEAECNSYAISAVANARQKMFDGLTFLAELEKTSLMFKEVVSRYTERCLVVDKHARTTYKTLKRGAFATKSTLTFSSVFSNTWMEYRYGWTPLSFDVKALYQQLLELERMFHRVKGKSESDFEIVTETVSETSGQGIYVGNSYITGGDYWRCETRRGVEYQITSTALIELTTAFRVTTDPILMAYELIPYSWMADWILNIGDLIRAFSPFALGDLRSCSVTVEQRAYIRSRMLHPRYPSAKYYCDTHLGATGAVEFIQTQRMPWTPTAQLDFRLELSMNRLLDLVALSVKKLSKTLRLLPEDENRYKLGRMSSAFFKNIQHY